MKAENLRNSYSAVIVNLLLSYLLLMAGRLVFVLVNLNLFKADLADADIWQLICGCLLFDTSAVCYLNSLYILLALVPVAVAKRWWRLTVKWSYILPNAAALVATFADSLFYPFNMRRVTSMVFSEFHGENNLGRIAGIEMATHWYLVFLAGALVWLMWKAYRPWSRPLLKGWRYYCVRILSIIVAGFLVATGMRGGSFFKSTRPISINEAHRFVSRPSQTAIVLNTPFSLIRTINQAPPAIPRYFEPEHLDNLFSPVRHPADSATLEKRNVVIIIVESFGAEFVGGLNRELDGGNYHGYTPFTDSLLNVAFSFRDSYANGAFSIDAMPAVLASLPRMEHPFVLSPFSTDRINSIASLLGAEGWHSAFFHGATNQSLGFNAFSRHAGFSEYYGMDEYIADPSTGGRKDFDGTWGIWDEEFLQYFCRKIGQMGTPFVASVFTLSSHHPFRVPDRYRDTFVDEGKYPLHKCIRYTDYALRHFFDEARRQSWYDNTIFVITADHASLKITHDVYNTELGHFRIPIIFFDPSGRLPRGIHQGVAQQIDIMPTLLDILGYDKPYIAFGESLLSRDPDKAGWAVNWDNVLQYINGDYVAQFDDDIKVKSLYDYRRDPLLRDNIRDSRPTVADSIELNARALIQSYFTRGKNDALTIEP